QILAFAYDPDRSRRQAAQQCLFDELARHELVLSSILNTVAQDHALNDSVRGHTGPMNSRHLANEVSPGVIDRMLEVAEANYGVAHRYYRLKARLLGLPKLVTYDQYAPVISNLPSCGFQEGRKSVLEAFARFDPQLSEVANLFFERRWIDAEVRSNKRGGAFSASTVPSVHPYILVNWTDKLRDVSTLAHELGHGIHQYLSRKQTYFNFHHPLTTAETASVMGEFLAFDHMLQTTPDPRVRLGLLCGKIEDAFATVFRQTVLTRFEQLVHAARRRERLSSDQLCEFGWPTSDSMAKRSKCFPRTAGAGRTSRTSCTRRSIATRTSLASCWCCRCTACTSRKDGRLCPGTCSCWSRVASNPPSGCWRRPGPISRSPGSGSRDWMCWPTW
ncbi:MAG: M3 family metallopeptidase, partial [Planctomycetaceae bacterium]